MLTSVVLLYQSQLGTKNMELHDPRCNTDFGRFAIQVQVAAWSGYRGIAREIRKEVRRGTLYTHRGYREADFI
jgi:hypothetical protein